MHNSNDFTPTSNIGSIGSMKVEFAFKMEIQSELNVRSSFESIFKATETNKWEQFTFSKYKIKQKSIRKGNLAIQITAAHNSEVYVDGIN